MNRLPHIKFGPGAVGGPFPLFVQWLSLKVLAVCPADQSGLAPACSVRGESVSENEKLKKGVMPIEIVMPR